MKPTIVTLSGGNDGGSVQVASFQEAFGEFSEARGRGRARRKARKVERQEIKSAKKQARIKKRADAQQARQQKRTSRVAMAQERRMQRKQGRLQRKALGEKEENEEENQMPVNQQEEQGGASEQEQSSSQEQGAETQTQDTTDEPQQEGAAEGEYETTQDSDVEAGDQEEAEIDAEQGESDEESGFTGELGFDGVIAMSPEDAQWNEYFSSAAGKKKINPKVKLLARRIEQRKHIIKVLEKNFARAQKRATQIANKIQAKISKQRDILAKMEAKLASYSKFEGDYSEARGGRSAVAKRKAEVRIAKQEARKERKAAVKALRQQNRANKIAAKNAAKSGGNETPVDRELNPEISEQRIEVPASEENSGFNGTGLIGLDEQNDIDAPETRKFDLKFSNADGAKPSIGMKEVLIGAAIGVAAILIIKKVTKGKK